MLKYSESNSLLLVTVFPYLAPEVVVTITLLQSEAITYHSHCQYAS